MLQVIRDKAQNAPGDLQGILLCRKITHIIGKLQKKVRRASGDSR